MTDAQLLTLESAARTDVGVVRRGLGQPDEDTILDARFRDIGDPWGVRAVFGVADGLGHTKGGKVASAQAINMFEEGLEHLARRGDSGIPGVSGVDAFLKYVVERIDHTLRQSSENNVTVSGMGTTLTAAVIDGNTARIVHAGDSRAYLLHAADKTLRQITKDETEESGSGPVPTNGIGCVADGVVVNMAIEPLADGEVLLLCTDGLWREVDDDLLRRILVGSPSAAAAVDRLIRAANQAGGHGNIGAVVVHVGATALQNDSGLDRLFPLAGAIPPGRASDPSAVPMPLPGVRQTVREVSEPVVARDRYTVMADGAGVGQSQGAALSGPAVLPVSDSVSASGSGHATSAPPPLPPAPGGLPGARGLSGGDPRRIAPPPRPPGAPETSRFMAAIAGFAVGAILCGLAWFLITRRSAKQEVEQPPPPVLEAAPVIVWHKEHETLYGSKVEYRTYTETGEETWVALQDDDPKQVGMVTEDDEVVLYLRVSPTYDTRASRVRATQFDVKIGQSGPPEAAAPDSLADVRHQRGSLEVHSDEPGAIWVCAADEQTPVAREAALFDRTTTDYVVDFTGLPLGEYRVGHGVLQIEQTVVLTEAQPERVLRLNKEG